MSNQLAKQSLSVLRLLLLYILACFSVRRYVIVDLLSLIGMNGVRYVLVFAIKIIIKESLTHTHTKVIEVKDLSGRQVSRQ